MCDSFVPVWDVRHWYDIFQVDCILLDAFILIQTFCSAALSIKMSILLYLPGLLVILFLRQGMRATLDKLVILLVIQTTIATPFLQEDPVSYLRSAFDFGRIFLYEWTVNWRLFSEEMFLSKHFAIALLIGHFSVLIAFGLFRWCDRDGGVYHVLLRGFRQPMRPASLGLITADCEYAVSVS